MRFTYITKVTSLFLVIFTTACTSPEEKANLLFVEGVKKYNSYKLEKYDYENWNTRYGELLNVVEKITTEYPQTGVAVKITSGQIQFSGNTLEQIREQMDSVKAILRIHATPKLLLNFLSANEKYYLGTPANFYTELVTSYTHLGMKNNAFDAIKKFYDVGQGKIYPSFYSALKYLEIQSMEDARKAYQQGLVASAKLDFPISERGRLLLTAASLGDTEVYSKWKRNNLDDLTDFLGQCEDVIAFYKSAQFDYAEQLLATTINEMITNVFKFDNVDARQACISKALVFSGRIEEAKELALKPHVIYSERAHLDIAITVAEGGDFSEAQKLINDYLLYRKREDSYEFSNLAIDELLRATDIASQLSDDVLKEELFRLAHEAALDNYSLKFDNLSKIAVKYYKNGRLGLAEKTGTEALSQYLTYKLDILEAGNVIYPSEKLYKNYLKVGDFGKALLLFKDIEAGTLGSNARGNAISDAAAAFTVAKARDELLKNNVLLNYIISIYIPLYKINWT